MNSKEKTAFNLGSQEDCTVLVCEANGRYYVLAPNVKYSHDLTDDPKLAWLMKFDHNIVYKPDDADLDDWDNLYVCWNADCAFPPMYLVSGQNDSDALEEFINWTTACVVEEPDIKDYDEDDLTLDDCGRWNDTSQVAITQVRIVMIIR